MLSTTSKNFKAELKAARLNAGLSGAEVCRQIDISLGMMARYESEDREDRVLPNAETLKKINDLFFSTAAIASKFGVTGIAKPSDQEIANDLPLQVLINAINHRGGDVIFKSTK